MARAGDLDQRITFQSFTTTPNGMGGEVKAWANIASVPTVWAGVVAGSGGEGFEEGRTNATATTTFTIRNRSDVSEVNRIVWRGENYNVRQVKRMGSRALYAEIVAERGVSD